MNRSTCFYVRIEREDKGTRKLHRSEKKRERKGLCVGNMRKQKTCFLNGGNIHNLFTETRFSHKKPLVNTTKQYV